MNLYKMELKDTVKAMESGDYQERFRAEYYQLAFRLKKLSDMLHKWDFGELEFYPISRYNRHKLRDIYENQRRAMTDYLECLEKRAKLEEINL